MELNHTIIPSLDKEASAQFFARIFGLSYDGPTGHFAPVRVNEALTLDFDDATSFDSHHLAFKVTDAEFDAICGRVEAEGIPYGSGPFALEDGRTSDWNGGQGVYFKDPNGHVLELLTAGSRFHPPPDRTRVSDQAAAIPVRRRAGTTEVCLITTSSGSRWTLRHVPRSQL